MTNIMFTLVGIIFLIIGIFLIRKTNKLKKTGINTTATVKEIVSTRDLDNSGFISTSEGGKEGYNTSLNFKNQTTNMFYPVISFTTKDGKEIIKQSESGSNPSTYKVGQEVKIFYPLENPEKFMIDNFINTKLLPYGIAIMGLILLIVRFFNR